MIDLMDSRRMERLCNSGKKMAYATAITAFRIHPFETAIKIVHDKLGKCEDREMQIDREIESKNCEVIQMKGSCL
jgi:hypothetical protein